MTGGRDCVRIVERSLPLRFPFDKKAVGAQWIAEISPQVPTMSRCSFTVKAKVKPSAQLACLSDQQPYYDIDNGYLMFEESGHGLSPALGPIIELA